VSVSPTRGEHLKKETKTMSTKNFIRALFITAPLALTMGCQKGGDLPEENVGQAQDAITNVAQTAVERQSIGNCWLYAEASWTEALNLSYLETVPASGGGQAEHTCEHLMCEEGASLNDGCFPDNTPQAACLAKICEDDNFCCSDSWDDLCVQRITEDGWCEGEVANLCEAPVSAEPVEAPTPLDVSQSYWTYWHWFEQVTGYMWDAEISTGGHTSTAHGIIRDRGVMNEVDFVPADSLQEMSNRQKSALNKINASLKNGELKTQEARRNGELVRQVFDDAWELTEEVTVQLDQAFGTDGEVTIRRGANLEGTNIKDPSDIPVRYAEMVDGEVQYKNTNLVKATQEFNTVRYPSGTSGQRDFQIRVQKGLHARQPMVVTWDVDFNAMENGQNERRGSFNQKTLEEAGGPGSQGGHQTLLHDYRAVTEAFGVLEAGDTLDPNNPDDAAKLAAALEPSTKITLFRTKNSWGGDRPDRAFAKNFPGYHDLWMDYLNGPIQWCPSEDNKTEENCRGQSQPLDSVLMPPGF
jgi:hypothetical protein